ncbi:hypothetical protein [Streptomyces natalensis]|uniref:hypothetical protein n=1 Tax=Streptomyces natalensis TaxID=68242 RepID=UPI000ADABEE5|nr:hypothetical protein [Streptomyces natalensis]
MTALQELRLQDPTNARDLLSEDAFRAITATVQRDNPEMGHDSASRIVAEALKFVATAAKFPDCDMRPSKLVDKGWHALILNTRVYETLCSDLGGFIHHTPDEPASTPARTVALDMTQDLMAEAGYGPDLTLWLHPSGAAECEGGPAMCCKGCGPKNAGD